MNAGEDHAVYGLEDVTIGEKMEKPIKELTIERRFDAPIELVWKAWTDRDIVQKWWGPRGVTNPTCEWEAKPNGRISIVMQAGQELGDMAGQKWPMEGRFAEVSPMSRLVFTSNAIDDVKKALLETLVTVSMARDGNKTRISIHIAVTKAVAGKTEFMLQGMEMGWNQQIDKLAALVAGQTS